jgi:hypothetical protein
MLRSMAARDASRGPQRFEKLGSPGAYYVLDHATGREMAPRKWSIDAVKQANALNVRHGACAECYGKGSVIVDWAEGCDGDVPVGADCPRCHGSGWEPH